MFIVCAKSTAAFVLGGALVGQQVDTNIQGGARVSAPPAPTVAAPPVQPQATTRQLENQVQSTVDQVQRQTYQAQDQLDAQTQNRVNSQLDQQGRAALGVSLSDDLRVTHISPGSPAARMGLQAGDEILSLNGQTFDSIDAFVDAVGATPQGQQIQIEFDRNGQRMTQSGPLAAWDTVHYSGTNTGPQTHSAMRYSGGAIVQGMPADGQFAGQFAGDACCDPCAGFGGSGYWDGGWSAGGYAYSDGYGWDGYGRRHARRAARRGYYW
jgi:membrane-associated protease RseP (regulator of RpoE activity)